MNDPRYEVTEGKVVRLYGLTWPTLVTVILVIYGTLISIAYILHQAVQVTNTLGE